MHRFWEKVIRPLFENQNIKRVVEIGAARGDNSKKILSYCKRNNGRLSIIDPAPQIDVNELKREFKGLYYLHEDISLNVLPKLTRYDAVLIDGDHNWYTVYHELKEIEKNAVKNRKFPLVFLHDIGWPYGRRDLYYNPDSIPKRYRKPYAQKGIAKGYSALIEPDNNEKNIKLLNPSMNNAIYENGDKNGVLTAVEDFLKETNFSISFHKAKSYHGLGILSPANTKLDHEIKNVIKRSGL